MIRAFFGLSKNPFDLEHLALLSHQQDIYDTLKVHCQQGGLCLLLGEPGTGKSVIKRTIAELAEKHLVTSSVSRTLHTYINTIKILCHALGIEYEGNDFTCEKRLIEEAFQLNRQGKVIITLIDDAHLMDFHTLRKLRLLFEDFPKNHNLVLLGQPSLLVKMSLKVHDDIKSRVTYSVIIPKLNPDDMASFIFNQLDRTGLGHNTFSEDALSLVVRSADGVLRKCRNLCLSCLLETVRAQKKCIDLDIVNRVLIQPHWRVSYDLEQI